MTTIAIAAGKYATGFDGTDREVSDAYEIVDLREALERTYTTDAHLVSYVVRGRSHQPRINKTGLAYFDGIVETTTFFCDVDNAGHGAWTDELVARAMREYETLDELATCGVYHTAHGRRIVQPLAEPILVANVEPYLNQWLLTLERAGIAVDRACRDWTRHFRLPHVRRDQRAYRSPFVALDRMRPIALDPIAIEPVLMDAPRERRTAAAPIAWSAALPPQWHEPGVHIARAVRESVLERWHEMYLALSGALLKRGLAPEHLPAFIRWIANAAGSVKPSSHESSARDTARRFVDRLQVTGHRTLRENWPAVADAVDDATATRTEARLREDAKSALPAPPLEDAIASLEDAIRNAPDGLTLISAECGIGKTRAAIRVAAERATKAHASPDATGVRAPTQSKTSISVDKNALAEQVTRDLRALGTPVRRIFGPLSVLRDDGTPECRYHDVARPLVEGGQPMAWELCQGRGVERCEFYEQCHARNGVDGPDDARVTVGPHALLSELNAAAGSTGLLVIDEPPPLLESVVLTRDDLDVALRTLGGFEGRFAASMAPALAAFTRWIDIADAEKACSPADAVREAGADIPDTALRAAGATRTDDPVADLRACAERAIPEEHRSQAPRLQRAALFAAKRSPPYARQLGTASKVFGTIRAALIAETPVAVRVDTRGLVFTAAREDLTKAVRREGAVVLTDANAELHRPILEKVVGYPPHFHAFAAADGALIRRTLIKKRSATRKGWFAHGRPMLDAGITTALRAVVDWIREDTACSRSGLITYRTLRLLLEGARHPSDTSIDDEWREAGHPRAALVEAREVFGPILERWPGEILFGHYGAVRGLNSMADADALVTFGDPWPNVGDVRNDIAFLGLDVPSDDRLTAMCRAELEQAHGRLRAVHRTRPGRALHVGSTRPGGYGWTAGRVELRRIRPGPPTESSAMPAERFGAIVKHLGGVRATARALACPPMNVSRYASSQRPVPSEIAVALERLVPPAGVTGIPIKPEV